MKKKQIKIKILFTATRFTPRSSLVDDVSWMFVVFGCRDTVFGSFHSIDVSTVHSRSNKRETILLILSHLFFDCSTLFFKFKSGYVTQKLFTPQRSK